MKKILAVLTVLFLTAAIPICTLAEDAAASPSPSPSPSASDASTASQDEPAQQPSAQPSQPVTPAASSSAPVSLYIDTENIYAGMSCAYKDGYTPVISGGNAIVVLPLMASGELRGNALTASLDLGSSAGSPFVFKNYEKSVPLSKYSVNNQTSIVSAYFVNFSIPLAADRYNGVYPVTVTAKALSSEGESIQQSFTIHVTITDGKDPNASPSPEPTPAPQFQPILLISGYTAAPSPAEAGSEFDAEITITNTSEKKHVYNMSVTLSSDPQLELLSPAASTYYERLKKGESITLKARYRTKLDTPAGRYSINLSMNYDNSDAMTLSSSGTVSVDIVQPLRVELTLPQITETVNAGDTLPLAIQVMNLSRTTAYNVRVELAAPGLLPTGTGFVGNMEAGTAQNADMNVFVGTKDMTEGYEGEKYGYTNGKIILVYEDADGNENRAEFDIATTINPPVITVSAEPEEEPEKRSQWWIAALTGGVIAAGLAAWLALSSKRRRRKYEDD